MPKLPSTTDGNGRGATTYYWMHVFTGSSQMSLNEPQAFRAFYDEALPHVYSFLFRRCGGVPTAEDLTQETFLAAVAEIRKGKRVKDPVPWVLGIARHKLLDHYRREKREKREALVDASASHIDTSDHAEPRERALATLQLIPALQREALSLRYLDGMSVPEVARAVGRSVHAAESLLARGRETFKRIYLEAGHE